METTHLPVLNGKTVLYVRSRAYDNATHPLRQRPQFRLEIGYGEADTNYAQGHKEFVHNYTTRAEFEAALSEAASLPDMELKSEETFGERIMGPNGLVPDQVTTRRYSTAFYRQMLDEING